jgi:hypothetical protein
MTDDPGSYRLSTARRTVRRDSPVLVVSVLGVIAVMILVAVFAVRESDDEPVVAATATPTANPASTPTVTTTPRPRRNQSGWVDATVVMPPTATPTMPIIEAFPTRQPRPTPSISQCAAYRFSTVQVFSPSAQVKVDIRVDNRCPYDLGPENLLFEITGWRDGARVQTVRGVPFEAIRRGRWGDLSIGLPGSLDWYDEIEVVVFD